jgi:hypothetical protein
MLAPPYVKYEGIPVAEKVRSVAGPGPIALPVVPRRGKRIFAVPVPLMLPGGAPSPGTPPTLVRL